MSESFSLTNPALKKLPGAVLTDSYKASHYYMYPESDEMVAYGEFRSPFDKDQVDSRIVYYGIRYIIENYVAIQWTEEDLQQAETFFNMHNVGFSKFPFPKDLFLKFIKENNGYFPVRIESLPEGTVCRPHVPVYQISAKKEYSRLVTFLETILTQVWYPSTVATLSRRVKDVIQAAFNQSVEPKDHYILNSRLHDFGFRGCTSVEQSVIGCCSHLLSFEGTDTLSAAYYAQFSLNNGVPVANSIPATEHSVMTAWATEEEAIRHTIKQFGGKGKLISIVMDSYDYKKAIFETLPRVFPLLEEVGGMFVIRPDSGDPVECVIDALYAGEAAGGAYVNSLGYKVLKYFAVLQGDGINYRTIDAILEATLKAGYSAQNVAFGMGGGLLQKVNRDTMSFATKLSYIRYKDGTERDVMKKPLTDHGKYSFPGILAVYRSQEEVDGTNFKPLKVYPTTSDDIKPETAAVGKEENMLKVVYDCGPVDYPWELFDDLRRRVTTEWDENPKIYNPVSQELQTKIDEWGQSTTQ